MQLFSAKKTLLTLSNPIFCPLRASKSKSAPEPGASNRGGHRRRSWLGGMAGVIGLKIMDQGRQFRQIDSIDCCVSCSSRDWFICHMSLVWFRFSSASPNPSHQSQTIALMLLKIKHYPCCSDSEQHDPTLCSMIGWHT